MKLYQIGELFALPLQSAIRAQNSALQETLSFIEQIGLDGEQVRTFRFKTERVIEERIVNPETGNSESKTQVQPMEVSIPLLAILPPPSVQLQEMNVEFGVEVVEPRVEPIKSNVNPIAGGSSLAPSLAVFTPVGQGSPTTMKVNMKIVRETPEGLARLGDLLANLLSGHTANG